MVPKPQGGPDAFWRRLVLPEEDRRCLSYPSPWNGSYRWFRSPNVVDLWDYRSAAEKHRIIDFMWRRQLEAVARFRVMRFTAAS
jgi:hypothetical protein